MLRGSDGVATSEAMVTAGRDVAPTTGCGG
jgi:hypothetical protein